MTDIVRKQCTCCEVEDCCAILDQSQVNFTPNLGFNLEYIYVSTSNHAQGCSGLSRVIIEVSQELEGMSCDPNCSLGSRCGALPASVVNEFWGQCLLRFGELDFNQTDNYSYLIEGCSAPCTPPVGYGLTSACSGTLLFYVPASHPYQCSCGESSYSGSEFLLTNYDVSVPPQGCGGNSAVLNYCYTNYMLPALTAIQGDLSGSPFQTTTTVNGYTCQYYLWGAVVATPFSHAACQDTRWNGFCSFNYETCSYSVRDFRVNWSVKCVPHECPADYSWPMTLSCNCSPYKRPVLTSSPVGTLYLDTTYKSFTNDKCYYIGEYVGKITAGLVDCQATPNDPDCKCCDEP